MKTLAVLGCISLSVALGLPLQAQSPSPSTGPDGNSISPDKQWQYVGGDRARVLKAATNETAVEFSCNVSDSSVLLWAPDSTRFAVTCPGGKGSTTSVYQLRDGKWETGDELGNGDKIMDRAGKIIDAQARKNGGLPKKTFLHMNRWTVEPEKWIDASTLVLYAEMWEVAHRRDGSFADASYATDLLLTLKFDDKGAWKIIKTHEMSEKEVKQRDSSRR